MTFKEYQNLSKRTALYPEFGARWVYPALGLASEAGEVADKIKKVIRDHGGEISDERRAGIQQELGDVLWYVAQLCSDLDLSMAETAQMNLDKLFSRQDRGKLGGSGDER
jgi:NTP pyrophosphatase (non-canonical NTP hydrolase)